MMFKHLSIYRLFIILIIFSLGATGTAVAVWDGDWSSYSTITLNQTAPTNNFQVHLSSDDFTIPSRMWANMNHDGDDTRFIHTDNTTVFPYWIDHLTAADNYSIWVNVTDATTGSTLFWYYENEDAPHVSNGNETFAFFDDFSTDTISEYTERYYATWQPLQHKTISNGELHLGWDGAGFGSALLFHERNVSSQNYSVVSRFRADGYESPPHNRHQKEIGLTTDTTPGYIPTGTIDPDFGGWHSGGCIDMPDHVGQSTVTSGTTTSDNSYVLGATDYHPGIWIQDPSGTVSSNIYIDFLFLSRWEANAPIVADIEMTVFSNTAPTTPIAIYPLDESYVLHQDAGGILELNVLSTDLDNDSLHIYFYGDKINGSSFLGFNDSVNGSTYNWVLTEYGTYSWRAMSFDGFNFSDLSDVFSFTYLPPPNLTSPANTTTIYKQFPPLTADITFDWEDLNSPQYRIVVATDQNFNQIFSDTHLSSSTSTQPLVVGNEYFWRLYSYDGSIYSNASITFQFNLTANSTLSGSAIEGVVYTANGDVSAISGAEVTIWNTTWSDSIITGSNGYYVFEDLNSGTVYNLQAKADRYWDSSISLVSAEDDPVTNNFYLIDDLTDTEWWHYVEFTLQNVWGVTYPGVATNVYIGDSVTIYESGMTGSDGTISFHLDQNVQYRITFINSTLGIDEDITLYPVAKSYTVYIDSYSYDLPDAVTDDIQAYIVSSRLDATHGYINFTWSDTSGLTTSIDYYISDVDGNELYNTSTSNPDIFDSQIVTAIDDRYIVRYVGVHPTHGIIDKTETVVFRGGRIVDLGWDSDWQYAVTALAFLIFIGALFGAKTAQYGAITVVMFAWLFKWIGWLDETNTSTLLIILAAVISFGWSLRKSEEVKM